MVKTLKIKVGKYKLEHGLSEIFKVLNELTKLIAAPRMLKPDEIKRVRDLANSFGTLYPLYIRKPLTSKMHALIFHVPAFVEEHGTIGLFSEEEGKSI